MDKNILILAINPGSTSTKIALYENREEKFTRNIEHSARDLSPYKTVTDQYPLRQEAVLNFLHKNRVELSKLSAVVGRGGLLPPGPLGGLPGQQGDGGNVGQESGRGARLQPGRRFSL